MSGSAAPAFGLIVVGTEILLGRRRDAHLAFCIEALAARGFELAWCHVVGDAPQRLSGVLASSMTSDDIVFWLRARLDERGVAWREVTSS